jgi:ribose transport system substrate-binding protein
MVELLGPEGGKVAVQPGIPTASNHVEKFNAHIETLKNYPQIEVIEAPPGMDDIAISQTGAAAVIAANPDLKGFLNCDAAAPVGQAAAVEEAGKAGEILIVGAENMMQIYEYILSGTIYGGYAIPAVMIGEMTTTMLFHMQETATGTRPDEIDTGLTWIGPDNAQMFMDIAKALS